MRNRKWMFVLILIVLLAACGKAAPTATPKPAATFDARPYVGRYEGTWTNQTVGTTGAVTAEIKTDNNRRTATVGLTFTGPYLSLSAPLATTVTGGWDAKQATITGKNPITGDLAVTVDMNGKITGTMKGAGEGKYAEIVISGLITAQRIEVTYAAADQSFKAVALLQKR
jgi:hypothetical protein